MREAFASGADFVLSKPVQQEQATRTLWAGYGSMLRERRRYFRHRLDVEAEVQLESGEKTPARTLNVSESGLAISATLTMRAGQKIWFSFILPDTNLVIPFPSSAACPGLAMKQPHRGCGWSTALAPVVSSGRPWPAS